MKQKAVTLINRGMSRDLSISKVDGSSAYENRNIRITVRDNDTTLSVTNERGTKEVSVGGSILGDLIGWNVLNNHIILFTHEDPNVDRIYRIDYSGDSFRISYGYDDIVHGSPLYYGDLGFDIEHPIESIVYFETETIQKIYWLDGIHPLRFMNFMAEKSEVESWDDGDNTHFDSNRLIVFSASASISKDNSGNTRPNGTVQYFLSYYNEHGQETGMAWTSDLVYLAPPGRGGAGDETNNNRVVLSFSGLDKRFTNFRVYSVFRSSLNGVSVAYIVGEGTVSDTATVVDDGSHLTVIDSSRLLYLGSRDLIAGTMTHKDQTLFLGDLKSTGEDYSSLKEAISETMFDQDGVTSSRVEFMYSGVVASDIPYPADTGSYNYSSQLSLSSSEILSFKGGEKYRFGLVFKTRNGADTRAFWIGDKENRLYPVIDINGHAIKRVVARCQLTSDVIDAMEDAGLCSVRLVIAEATYADRSVKAQGIVSPTMFNVWERFNKRLYSMPSWIFRPRHAGFAWRHFDPVHNSTSSDGEIQCNYWTYNDDPTPFYMLDDGVFMDDFDGVSEFDHLMLVYGYKKKDKTKIAGVTINGSNVYYLEIMLVKAKLNKEEGRSALESYDFTQADLDKVFKHRSGPVLDFIGYSDIVIADNENYTIKASWLPGFWGSGTRETSKKNCWNASVSFLADNNITDDSVVVPFQGLSNWFEEQNESERYRVVGFTTTPVETDLLDAMNSGNHSSSRWINISDEAAASPGDYTPSYFKKHLMFVDENVVTLNSPELDYEAVAFDNVENWKFRIVGVAKISSSYSDYTVDASHGYLSGENLASVSFSSQGSGNLDGLSAWPLWRERGIDHDETSQDDDDYYVYGGDVVRYWLYMWHHNGKIDGYWDMKRDEDRLENDYSDMRRKVFANMRFSYCTMYGDMDDHVVYPYDPDTSSISIRLFNHVSSQYVGIGVAGSTRYYDGNPDMILSLPASHEYPILFSPGNQETTDRVSSDSYDITTNEPVRIQFRSNAHAVIALPTSIGETMIEQSILPAIDGFTSEYLDYATHGGTVSGALIPWEDISSDTQYGYKDYTTSQWRFDTGGFSQLTDTLEEGDNYMYIGEVYYDYSDMSVEDTRYGGTSESAIESCRFVTAGPSYSVDDVKADNMIVANQGDTYFQRWDCVKTIPTSSGSVNNVFDIASVMLETHVNIDGRTDLNRGVKYLASIDPEKFGTINPVYSQNNNFITSRALNSDADMDIYRSSITWTLDKSDSADIDEWTHVTLANSLKLDGDKGWCRALRRFNNSIIAFQDRAISEVLFNSRTQLSTTSGVPVEIANSGKVDGKRYISNKFGCVNKWSIVEGKAALYFVDNINKVFCSFGGDGIQPLSTRLGFDAWFRRINSIEPWTPKVLAGDKWNNMVSYYDRIHSDIYLVGSGEAYGDIPCLVYNESLGVFTSFYDYSKVPMMANVDDRFVSVRDHKLWLQNEGLYCNFFGVDYGYSVEYRVTPDPFGDKIWTNVDYRADYYRLLDGTGDSVVPERLMINGEFYDDLAGTYQDTKTFDSLRIWNEYQNTGEVALGRDYTTDRTTRRKFRIWHVAIPRSVRTERNKWGLDRIRNPWISLLFRKNANADNRQDMAQIHDVTVRYFE